MTPPVAMSSYAAAAIAEGSPMRVALISVRIGFVVFIVPYLLVYFPQLMMMGSIFKIMTCLLTAMSGIIFLSAGMTGILIHATLLWERFLCFIIGILLFLPGLKTDIPGFALGAAVIIFHLFYHRRIAPVRLEHEGIAWEARSE